MERNRKLTAAGEVLEDAHFKGEGKGQGGAKKRTKSGEQSVCVAP